MPSNPAFDKDPEAPHDDALYDETHKNPAPDAQHANGIHNGNATNGSAGNGAPPPASQNGGTGEKGGPGGPVVAFSSSSPDDAEVKKQERRERKPVWFCQQICNWPKLSFGVTLLLHDLMITITFLLMRTGYDIIPITFDRLPLDLQSDVDYLRDMAWTNRDQSPDFVERNKNEAVQALRSQWADQFVMLFEIEDGNVFTEANLKEMERLEEKYWGEKQYQEKFCLLDTSNKCEKPRSILRYFDGTYSWVNPTVFKDYGSSESRYKNYVTVLYTAYSTDATKRSFEWFLGKNASFTPTAVSSAITRASFLYGFPLEGYKNATHNDTDQVEKLEEYLLDEVNKMGKEDFKNGAGDMVFVYFVGRLLGLSISSQVIKDMALAIGSLLTIIVFMCGQTGSLFITGFTIWSIITGFCAANLIYRVVLDYVYFGIFHVLAIFIILGIGADDVFVFVDTWKETAHHRYPTLAHRMSDAYRKAALAMLFTSITTALAFVVSATSPFLGINSFGVFAAILICVNYLSVIIFLPCCVLVHHLYFEKYKCCCCCPRPVTAAVSAQEAGEPELRKNAIVRFFRGPYYHFITHKIARWCILTFYAILIAVFLYFATQIKVNEEQVKFLPEDSNFGRYLVKRSAAFASGGEFPTTVSIVWGLHEQDMSGCHKTNVSCTGETQYDKDFNLNSPTLQNSLRQFCQDIRDLDQKNIEKLGIQKDPVTDIPEVECFLDNMDNFYTVEENREIAGTRRYPVGTDLNSPWGATEAKSIMQNNAVYSKDLTAVSGFNRNFEVALSFWLYNGFVPEFSKQMGQFGSKLGEAKNEPYTSVTNIPVGGGETYEYSYGNKLMYASIVVNMSINGFTLGFPAGLPYRDAWEEYVVDKMKDMPDELQNGWQMTDGLWHWLKVQQSLASSAVVGVVIGLCLAFPVLVIATSNIIVGLMATITIVIITISVVGVIPMAGWKLGVLESLNLVLVVGLAVDYVVHLAEGYSRSAHNDRKNRLRDSLDEVGISVLSGACTTLGASMFLLGAHILFFSQFGIFMFSTIGFSILYALGFFTTMLGIMGPQNEFGSLKPLYRWIGKKCCCGKKD